MKDSSKRAGRQIFRRASLERLTSPEHVDELMRVTQPRAWIALATLAVLVVGAVAWSILGQLPVVVSARGVLLSPAKLAPLPELSELVAADVPLVSLTCFAVRDGGRVLPGMSLGVSPDAVPRERYGELVGKVVGVTKAPIPTAVVAKVLNNAELAAQWVPAEGCILVLGTLTSKTSSKSGYRWSSSRGPDLRMITGLLATAKVVVERRTPISYVIPMVRGSE